MFFSSPHLPIGTPQIRMVVCLSVSVSVSLSLSLYLCVCVFFKLTFSMPHYKLILHALLLTN